MEKTFRQRVGEFDWQRAEPLHALLCLPAVVVPLLAGAHFGFPGTAVLMAGGALSVGYGSFQKPLYWRWGPMLLAAFGIAISGAVGVLVSPHAWSLTLAVVLWSAVYGLSNVRGPAAAWVGLQCVVYLVISSASVRLYAAPEGVVKASWLRGSGLLAGGMLQFAVVVLLWQFVPRAESTFSDPNLDTRKDWRDALAASPQTIRFTWQIALTALVASVVYESAGFNNAYWIPMTALLVPREDFYDTTARGLLRFLGTIAGAVVCTLLTVVLHPAGETLALLAGLFLFACYWLQSVNYGAFAFSITGYIVFLLAMVHLPQRSTILHRVEATVIGGAIAMLVHAAFHLRRRTP